MMILNVWGIVEKGKSMLGFEQNPCIVHTSQAIGLPDLN